MTTFKVGEKVRHGHRQAIVLAGPVNNHYWIDGTVGPSTVHESEIASLPPAPMWPAKITLYLYDGGDIVLRAGYEAHGPRPGYTSTRVVDCNTPSIEAMGKVGIVVGKITSGFGWGRWVGPCDRGSGFRTFEEAVDAARAYCAEKGLCKP